MTYPISDDFRKCLLEGGVVTAIDILPMNLHRTTILFVGNDTVLFIPEHHGTPDEWTQDAWIEINEAATRFMLWCTMLQGLKLREGMHRVGVRRKYGKLKSQMGAIVVKYISPNLKA